MLARLLLCLQALCFIVAYSTISGYYPLNANRFGSSFFGEPEVGFYTESIIALGKLATFEHLLFGASKNYIPKILGCQTAQLEN
jgi:hypothetical protein